MTRPKIKPIIIGQNFFFNKLENTQLTTKYLITRHLFISKIYIYAMKITGRNV